MFAARRDHLQAVIVPALARGEVVLCDRFLDSSAAYQGGGRELGVEAVLRINAPAVEETKPDLTVFLKMPHREALRRRCSASDPDRLEMEADSFHARVEEAYDRLIARDPQRFAVVDATKSVEHVAEEVAQKVLIRLMEAER